MTVTFNDLKTALKTGNYDMRHIWKNTTTIDNTGALTCMWRLSGYPIAGSAPSTNEAPTMSTTGAMHLKNPSSGKNSFISKFALAHQGTTATFMLIDILSWSAGLSGTVTTVQTTNLPTPALTRYTNGEDVKMGLICWTVTGSTTSAVVASYTNEAGTAGRSSPSVNLFSDGFGGSQTPAADQVQILPLQAGDRGVRSVESVDLTVSTLTAGNFGVILFKILCITHEPIINYTNELSNFVFTNGSVEKIDDACLSILATSTASTNLGTSAGFIQTVEVTP